MRIIARKTLRLYWEAHPDARQALQSWYADVKRAEWNSPADVKRVFRNASIIANNRIVFNIKGNRYRLIVAGDFSHHIVFIRFIGTHSEYDKTDASTI